MRKQEPVIIKHKPAESRRPTRRTIGMDIKPEIKPREDMITTLMVGLPGMIFLAFMLTKL